MPERAGPVPFWHILSNSHLSHFSLVCDRVYRFACNTLPSCAIKDHPKLNSKDSLSCEISTDNGSGDNTHTHTHTQIGISLGEGDSWSCQKSFQLRRVAVLPFSWGVDRLPNAQSSSGNQRERGWGWGWGRGWGTTGNRFIEFSFRFTQGDCCFDNAPRKALREELCRMRYLLLLCSQLSLDWSPSPN